MAKCPKCEQRLSLRVIVPTGYLWIWCESCHEEIQQDHSIFQAIRQAMLEAGQKVLDQVNDGKET